MPGSMGSGGGSAGGGGGSGGGGGGYRGGGGRGYNGSYGRFGSLQAPFLHPKGHIYALSAVVLIFIIAVIIAFDALSYKPEDPYRGIVYDETKLSQFSDEQYYRMFSNEEKYESNILIVFVVYDTFDCYHYMAYGGFSLDDSVKQAFDAPLKMVMVNKIPDYYEYALTYGLKGVILQMRDVLLDGGAELGGVVESDSVKVCNYSTLSVQSEVVGDALKAFTRDTGIPIALVIEDGRDIFGEPVKKNYTPFVIFVLVTMTVILSVIFVYKKVPRSGWDELDDIRDNIRTKVDQIREFGYVDDLEISDEESEGWHERLMDGEFDSEEQHKRRLSGAKYNISKVMPTWATWRSKELYDENPHESKNYSCLWHLLSRFILPPIILCLVIMLLKACGL